MIAVAVAAGILGAVRWNREMNRRASRYAQREVYHLIRGFDGTPDWIRNKQPADVRRRVDYHAALARKWNRAYRYPWLPVEPDPPEPEWARASGPFDAIYGNK
jgi:hypothetical protein